MKSILVVVVWISLLVVVLVMGWVEGKKRGGWYFPGEEYIPEMYEGIRGVDKSGMYMFSIDGSAGVLTIESEGTGFIPLEKGQKGERDNEKITRK